MWLTELNLFLTEHARATTRHAKQLTYPFRRAPLGELALLDSFIFTGFVQLLDLKASKSDDNQIEDHKFRIIPLNTCPVGTAINKY